MKADINMFGIDLLKYYMYLFDASIDTKYFEDYISTIDNKSVAESYAITLLILFNDLVRNNLLYEDYITYVDRELPYIRGRIDLNKSINKGSFQRNCAIQSVSTKSIFIPINLCIKYCIDTIMTYPTIASNSDFCKFVNKKLYEDGEVFNNLDKFNLSDENTTYFLNVAYSCRELDSYECYFSILNVCILYLENLYACDCIEDLGTKDSLFDFSIEKIMESFLRTAIRHVMIRLSRNEKYSVCFKNNWSMRNRDRVFEEAGAEADIVVKYKSKCDLKNLVIDCKTNHRIVDRARSSKTYCHNSNKWQIQGYVDEFTKGGTVSSNTAGVLFHFLNHESTFEELALDKSKIGTGSGKELYIWVFKLLSDTEPKEFEDWLFNRFVEFYDI